ncbi:MAG: ABC transporter ATP-binding protein/permease [Candidatus Kapabacteria bacterium]|jgi:ATP-binding cassette subfamily B protein|nr:ABC transporter ATP-binding protein/permease [Candidatus Kapabacteria bacterium]
MNVFKNLFDRLLRALFTRPASDTTPGGAKGYRERFFALRNLPRFFALIWKVSPPMMLATTLLRVGRAAVPVLALYVGKLIVDEVVMLTRLPSHSAEHLWQLVAIEFGIAVVSDVLNRAIALLDSLLGDLFTNATSVDLMRYAATLDLEMFEDSTFYDKLEKARRQTTSRISLMTQSLAQAQDLVSMLVLAGGLAAFAPWLLALLLITVIPAFISETRFNQKSYSLMNSWTPKRRELDYLRYIGASDETAKEVKIFGLANYLADRYKTVSDEYFLENRALVIGRASWGGVLAMLGTAGYYAAYIVIIAETIAGKLSLGDMTFLAGSFRSLRGTLEGVLGRFAGIAEGALYLQDLFDFFALKPRIEQLTEHSSHAAPMLASEKKLFALPRPIREGFVFENVGFKYVNAERWALRNVSFELRAAEKLALVGENGAGKTTLVKLLARLYDPTEGRILLDGRDLREYDVNELRSEIGVIFQDFIRYQMQAVVNIAVGRISERENKPRIDHAAAQSLADTVIKRLPEGYEQMVGRYFQKGVDLSGGEWQKLGLARAYMRDAQVLILDEPTAALDARAEHEVFERFTELTAGKTAVLISHRFSTVRMADRILVLEGGKPCEIGSHEELLAADGRYAELFRLQQKGYM